MGEIQVLTLNPPKTRVSELTLGWNVAMNRPPKVEILTLSATMRAPQALTVRISPPSISVNSFYFGDPAELCKPNEKKKPGEGETSTEKKTGNGAAGGFSPEDAILPWDENAPGSAEDDSAAEHVVDGHADDLRSQHVRERAHDGRQDGRSKEKPASLKEAA